MREIREREREKEKERGAVLSAEKQLNYFS